MAKSSTPADGGALAADTVSAQVIPAPAPSPAPNNSSLGPSLGEIATPEAAVSALKAKVSILHTLTHNVANFSTLAFNDVEQLMADIGWLTNYIRSKV